MSDKPSTSWQPSSPGASEPATSDLALVEAVELMAQDRGFGLVWIDADLVARRRYGSLADFVPIGLPITETVPPLMGLDADLLALPQSRSGTFQMPNVAIIGPDGHGPRLNIIVRWMERRQRYLLVVVNVMSTGELEIGLAQQVRKRMIAEAALAEKSRDLAAANAELTRANRDLAEFAYIISHDLKAPLRAMRYYADDVETALARGNETEARDRAGEIRMQSRRMSQMLTDLLAYSRIGRSEEALESIDTGALIEAVTHSLPRPRGIEIEITGHWPTIETYPAPLDLVLRNLVGNAVAHHDRERGYIRVNCDASPHSLIIEVTDDGPGIPKEWQEAIFLPFRTVPDRSTADGMSSGIGLALVRRTAEALGAKISVTSAPLERRGTKFMFEWPLVLNS